MKLNFSDLSQSVVCPPPKMLRLWLIRASITCRTLTLFPVKLWCPRASANSFSYDKRWFLALLNEGAACWWLGEQKDSAIVSNLIHHPPIAWNSIYKLAHINEILHPAWNPYIQLITQHSSILVILCPTRFFSGYHRHLTRRFKDKLSKMASLLCPLTYFPWLPHPCFQFSQFVPQTD